MRPSLRNHLLAAPEDYPRSGAFNDQGNIERGGGQKAAREHFHRFVLPIARRHNRRFRMPVARKTGDQFRARTPLLPPEVSVMKAQRAARPMNKTSQRATNVKTLRANTLNRQSTTLEPR